MSVGAYPGLAKLTRSPPIVLDQPSKVYPALVETASVAMVPLVKKVTGSTAEPERESKLTVLVLADQLA